MVFKSLLLTKSLSQCSCCNWRLLAAFPSPNLIWTNTDSNKALNTHYSHLQVYTVQWEEGGGALPGLAMVSFRTCSAQNFILLCTRKTVHIYRLENISCICTFKHLLTDNIITLYTCVFYCNIEENMTYSITLALSHTFVYTPWLDSNKFNNCYKKILFINENAL